ncbi:peptidase family M13 [Oesophagostomum dentatum]|uniref:Peptidase family M13 n=1 Tax=Oesophagostomum dentatum TaxID=61180 RepID=A0A0B1TSJ6_OESDE|nr:peptidase family M13 [Oesophagostomum dentatum]
MLESILRGGLRKHMKIRSLGGVLAFLTYHPDGYGTEAWRAYGQHTYRKVAGLELSNEQMFFVGYAQSWCALKSKQQRGVHMVEKLRVTGTLQNSPDFATAFSCPLNSPMNPSQKCTLW